MSSIYRKGRDGYFYYQTYVNNPKTNKKDKRIFHSLGTKDKDIAKRKQIKLDVKYENFDSRSRSWLPILQIKYYLLGIMIISALLTYNHFLSNNRNSDMEIQNLSANFSEETIPQVENNREQPLKNNTHTFTKDKKNEIQSFNDSLIVNNNKKNDDQNRDVKEDLNLLPNKITPLFEVIKVEKFLNGFDQGKISVICSNTYGPKELKLICQILREQYNKFPNLVISIYSNDLAGRELAMGKIKFINGPNMQKVWLALYTFNAVEGEYFDHNPGSFVGA